MTKIKIFCKKKEKTLAITILSKIITKLKYNCFNEPIKIKTIENQCSIKRFENNYF
jgi:hypothetical protein